MVFGQACSGHGQEVVHPGPVHLAVQVIQVGKNSTFALHGRLLGCPCRASRENQV